MKKTGGLKGVLSRFLIIAGTVLIVATIVLETQEYPWRTLYLSVQDEASIADPAPIMLEGEDSKGIIQEEDDAQSNQPSEEVQILPGAEEGSDVKKDVYLQLGILKIPKLNISQFILEGTQRQLRFGVGHVTGTAGIGEQGNCAIAGHRVTPFRYLDKLSNGDTIVLKKDHVYTYLVFDAFDVLPDETWVLSDLDGESHTLTLITCTPYLVSTHRLIIRARLVSIDGMTPEAFVEGNKPVSSKNDAV